MRRRLLWSSLLLVPLLVVGVAVLAVLEARDRLGEILVWVVPELVPGLEVELEDARLESLSRVVADGVVLSFRGATKPFLTAETVDVRFDWRAVLEGRLGALRVVSPVVRWTPDTQGQLAGTGGSGGFSWSIDHVSIPGGHLELSQPPEIPDVALDFDFELDDVGLGDTSQKAERDLAVTDVRVGPADQPLVTSPRIEASLSFAEVLERRVGRLRIERPRIDLAAGLPEAAAGPAGEPPGFWIGHLVVEDGQVSVPASAPLPAVAAGFGLDMKDVSNEGAAASAPQEIELREIRATIPGPNLEPMATVPAARVELSLDQVLGQRTITAVRIPKGAVLLDGRGRTFLLGAGDEAAAGGADPWRIGTFDIGTLAVHLAELGPPLPDVTFDLHTTMKDLPLSAAAAKIADQAQQIELASLSLYSPFDPFKKVVTIGSVFVDFSLGGLVRQDIARVKLVRPTIYLAEDLFWYMANEREDDTGMPPSPWTIDLLQAELGSLILEIGKVQRVGLPITFQTEARDVKLDNLADLELAAKLEVPQESYTFPEYDVFLDRVHGDLQFDYPPGQGSENFVSTLYANALQWRDYSLQKGWLSLTFDPKGINGSFGGEGYAGYVNGGVTVPYAWDQPWVGWISATDLDLAELTAVVAGGAVEMTGPLDASIALTIAHQSLAKAQGDLSLPKPGRLEITRLEKFQIPAGWSSWQRDLGRIAIDTLKNFDYDQGQGKLRFEEGLGLATLDLEGPNGGRKLEVRYHGERSDPLALDVGVASREDGK